MAGVSTPELVAAISNNGGLGSLGLGSSSVDHALAQIRRTRESTIQSFNVNFFCHERARFRQEINQTWLEHLRRHFLDQHVEPPTELHEIYRPIDDNEAMVDMLLHEKPRVVSFHFGLPAVETIRSLQGYGARVLVSVTSLHEGQIAQSAGVDAVVAQGYEAGGHRGNFDASIDDAISLTPLLQILVDKLEVPIIAAGGIMNGRGISAALAHGAIGAQLGTAFLLCPEAGTTAGHRKALKSPAACNTTITRAISGRPARGITGIFQNQIEPVDRAQIPDYPIAYDAAKRLNAAAQARNNLSYLPNWAGQAAALCRELPAAQLIECLVNELAQSRTE